MSNPASTSPVLGIDLGTSTCLACMMRNGVAEFIQPDRAMHPAGYSGLLSNDSNIMRSIFARINAQTIVGDSALRYLVDPEHASSVVAEVKRRMHEEGLRRIRVGDMDFAPSQIAGRYVQVLRIAAERQLGYPEGSIRRAVVTVPASFGERQIEATLAACEIGGLVRSQVHLIDEPVAAAYSLKLHEDPDEKIVLVADLGGGTFDVTLLRVGRSIGGSGYDELGRDGELYLGGLDWDREIAQRAIRVLQLKDTLKDDYVEAVLDEKHAAGPNFNGEARAAHNLLYERAESAKKQFYRRLPSTGPIPNPRDLGKLTLEAQTRANGRPCPAIIAGDLHLKDTEGLVKRCLAVCERMFHDASQAEGKLYNWSKVDLVYLAGGGSYMATVREAFAQAWGKKRDPIISPEPQHAVALGAALAADDIMRGRPFTHLRRRRYPHAVGIATYRTSQNGEERRFLPIVPRHAPLPFKRPYSRTTPLFIRAGASNRLRIIIEEQSASLGTSVSAATVSPSVNGHISNSQADDGAGHQLVKTLWIEDLPEPIRDGDDQAVISVNAGADGILHFRIQCRGKEKVWEYDRETVRGETTS